MRLSKLYLLFFTLFLSCSVFSQVVINEYSCSNVSTITDNYGEYEDWIELYNKGGSSVNLAGYYLSDSKTKIKKWTVPTGITIPANGRVMFWASGRNIVVGTNYHTNFKIQQTKPDGIILANSLGAIIDSLSTNPTQDDHSRARVTDGALTWSLFTTPTPNAANTGALIDYAARPTMSVAAGFYASSQSVSLACSTSGADIYYTTDGSIPTTGSTKYTVAINIAVTTVLRARAFHPTNTNIPPSFVETNTYFINVNHTIGVVSVASKNYTNLFSSQMVIQSSLEYFDKNKVFQYEVDGGEVNKHGNDSWAFPQKGFDYVLKDVHGYNYAINNKIFAAKPRTSFNRIILKAGASDNYPFANTGKGCHIRDAFVQTLSQKENLELDERSYEPCILYINGQYWGIYEIREKVDDDHFTDYYYDQDEYNIDVLAYWGGMTIKYGSDTAWKNLYTYIMANNMAVQSKYDYVASKLNVNSVMDNAILNTFIVNSDWINWNTMWWRGRDPNGQKKKWRYSLWDQDNVFDLGENYSGWSTTTFNADPCDIQSKFQNAGANMGHMDVLVQLMKNAQFKNKYVSRYAELIAGPLSCTNVLNHLNGMIATIAPEMPGQIARWGGTMTGWQNNVTYIQTQINGRCGVISKLMKDCYKVTGPYNITIDVEPLNAGKIMFNFEELKPLPWTSTYFGGINNTLETIANPGYKFDYWELSANTMTPDVNTALVNIRFTAADKIIAHFKSEDADHIPTAFSPNGDGVNDMLYFLSGMNISEMELVIYNRWGQVVFETRDISKGWDGTFKGQAQNSGVYAYKLAYSLSDGTSQLKNGNITLLR